MKRLITILVPVIFTSCSATIDNQFRPLKAVIVENAQQAKEAGATKLTLSLSTINGSVAGVTIPTGMVPIGVELSTSNSEQIVVEIDDLQAWPHRPEDAKLDATDRKVYKIENETFVPLNLPAIPSL